MTLAEAIISAADTAGKVIFSAARGDSTLVEPSVFEERIAECHRRSAECFEGFTGQCKECRCFVSIAAKVAAKNCPRGYWKKISS